MEDVEKRTSSHFLPITETRDSGRRHVRLRPDRASMGSFVLAKDNAKGIAKTVADAKLKYLSATELGNIFLEFDDWRPRYEELLRRVHCSLFDSTRFVNRIAFSVPNETTATVIGCNSRITSR